MIYTHGDHIVDYVSRKISDKISFQNPTGIGLADDSGKILLGVVIDNHRIESNSVCISLAISDKKHFTRKFIKQIFPTVYLACFVGAFENHIIFDSQVIMLCFAPMRDFQPYRN